MKTPILYCCFLLFITSYGQQPVLDETFPAPKDGAAFIYHPKSKALLLIGGSTVIPDSSQSNVWKWDGKVWSKIDADGPGSRSFFMGGLNAKTGLIQFFGGKDVDEVAKGDLWSFDGVKWNNVVTNNIGTRDHHSMVYADHLDAFVLYGGNNRPKMDSATWLLKNGKFTSLQIPGPGVRYHSGMAYDKRRKKVVLYGGGVKSDEHWEFDGAKWTKIVSHKSPGSRYYHKMVYHDDLKMIILHGGWINQDPRDPRNSETPTTWAWDGIEWVKITEERIFSPALGYDPTRKTIVAYGRTENFQESSLGLWEFKDRRWIRIADYGKFSAVEYLKQRVDQHPDDMQALLKYADILQWQTKQWIEAEDAYKKLAKVYPQNFSLLKDLALVLLMQSKIEEAEKYLAEVNEAGLMDRYSYIRLAGLLSQEKKYREAVRYQEKALEMDPKGGDFFKLASWYALLEESNKAFEALNKANEYGFNAKGQYENNASFESLKSDARWKQLVEKLK